MTAAGSDEYGTAFQHLLDSRKNNPVRYEVLKRCSLMTAISRTAFAVAADGLEYSFEELRRVLAAHPAEAGWFQLNGMVRKGAWAAWWLDGQEESYTAAGLPAAMTETAALLAAQLTRVDGDTAMIERLRLLVLAGLHREAVDEFDRWYPEFENVADFTVCRKLAEAVAPDDLRRFAADALDADLLRRRERAERRLELSAGLQEYFERTRHYVSRRDIEGILEAAVHGVAPPKPGVIPDGITPGPPRVIHLHAGGGMGKSTQLAWLVSRFGIQRQPAVLSAVLDAQSMVSERVRDVPELLLVIAAERLLEQSRALDREQRGWRLAQFLRTHGHRRRELDREFAPPGYAPLQRWNAAPLPPDVVTTFADALNEIADGGPVLICLDTTDELLQAEPGELAAMMTMWGRLVRQVPWLRLVLSGRSDVTTRPDFREAFRDVPWRALRLEPFTAQEARTYLELRGVATEQAERIVAVCEQDIEGSPTFNPLVLALLADSPHKLPAAGDPLYLFVVDRELDHIEDDYTRTALKYCAVARHPTYEYFLKVLFPLLPARGDRPTDTGSDLPADPEGLWRRLLHYARRSAWISAQDTRLNVHVNVRRELLRTMRSTEERVWRQLHRDAAVRCADLAGRAGSAHERAGWVAEQVYHQLHSAVDRRGDHDAFLDEVAQTWRAQVDAAWRRGDFATVIDLADRLLSADLERPDSEPDGSGEPDPQVMSPQLWYDIALERAYGELHAVLYGGRAGWSDVERYLRLVGRRSTMRCPGRPAVRQDRLRVEVASAALLLRQGQRTGLDQVHTAHERLRAVLEERRPADDASQGLEDLWVADAQLLLASCQVRIGRAHDLPHLSHTAADRDFTTMFESAVARGASQAPLVARYAMQDWALADRPDLVRAWYGRLGGLGDPVENWLHLLAADAELRSGLPLAAERFPRSGFSPDDLRADLMLARSQLLVGEAEEAERMLSEVTLPAVAGQVETELAFETLMVLARASAQVLELERAETYAGMAMGRASDDERRLSVMVLRASIALSVAGDLGRANQWISRSRPLREGPRGPAGTAMNGAECALLHRWERFAEAEELVRRWGEQLGERRESAGRQGEPPTAAEWLSYGFHAVVSGPADEVKHRLATVTTACASIPDMNRRFMLLAEQARLYAAVVEKGLLTHPARVNAIEQLLGRQRSEGEKATRPAGLRALWSSELHGLLLGDGRRAVADLRTAAELLGRDNRQLHATWLRLHPLLPEDLLPAPLPRAQAVDTTQRLTLRGADLMARARHTSRRQRRRAAAEAAALLRLTGDTDPPTVWHLVAARAGGDTGISADVLAELLHTPMIEEARCRNLQFALQRLGRYEPGVLPTGRTDERWHKAWAAYRREVRGEVPAHLRQAVRAAADVRPVTQVEVDVQGSAVGGAAGPGLEPSAVPPEDPSSGPVVWRATEDFLLSPESVVAGEQPVDVLLLHGDMRPYDQGAALRMPGSARSIRPEDVDAAVRKLCEQRRQAPPLVVLDGLPQEAGDDGTAELRDLFAFQLHLLGYVPTVLTSGPIATDLDGSWRRTALRQAVAFGRTAHQIAERLQQMAVRHGGSGARIRLLTHIPEEETFGIGLL
ncbi:hypothetical protein [Streptomyces sp. NPDC003635]